MKNKKVKVQKPVEESLFLRLLWFCLAVSCFYMVALVDPAMSGVVVCGLKIPLLLADFWVAIIGCSLSFHFRHQNVKWPEYIGLLIVALNCYWFVQNLQFQFESGQDIDLLLPTVHLVTGMFVAHSFELRTRFDFNFSLGVSLIIVCYTAALGKGLIFGLGLSAYVALAAALLLLDCEAKTFGIVQARGIDQAESHFSFYRQASSEKTANIIVPTISLLLLSICFFLAIPRAESFADQIAAKFYAMVRHGADSTPTTQNLYHRVRTPVQRKKRSSQLDDQGATGTGSALDDAKGGPGKSGNGPETGEHGKPGGGSGQNGKKSGAKYAKDSNGAKNGTVKIAQKGSSAGRIASGKVADYSSSPSEEDSEPPAKNGTKPKQDGQKATEDAALGMVQGTTESENATPPSAAKKKKEGDKSKAKGKKKSAKGKKGQSDDSDANGKDKDASGKSKKHKGSAKNTGESEKTVKDDASASINDSTAAAKKDSGEGSGNDEGKIHDNPNSPSESSDASRKPLNTYNLPNDLDADASPSTEETPIFTVACNRTIFFRAQSLDYFDGHKWKVSNKIQTTELNKLPNGMFSLSASFFLPPSVPAIRLTQKFHILVDLGNKVVIAGKPSALAYPAMQMRVDGCGNITPSLRMMKDLDYTVYGDEPIYDIKKMRAEGLPDLLSESSLSKDLEPFLQVPANQSDELYAMSRQIAGLQDNWFAQAEKICAHLRKNYKYENSSAKKKPAQNAADRFLFSTRTGDCKDFATAFVMLCRASGVPARLVVGFTEGEFDPATGLRKIRLRNTHAWGEVYFPSCGWVPFDATPTGVMPAKEIEGERYFSSLGQEMEKSLNQASNGSAAGAGSNGNGGNNGGGLRVPLPNGKNLVIKFDPAELLKNIPFLIAAIVFSGPLIMVARAVLSGIRLPEKLHPASRVYLKAQKDLRTIGVNSGPSQTPGEFLERVRERVAQLEEQSGLDVGKSENILNSVTDFVASYNSVFFGTTGDAAELERKRQNLKQMLAHVPNKKK